MYGLWIRHSDLLSAGGRNLLTQGIALNLRAAPGCILLYGLHKTWNQGMLIFILTLVLFKIMYYDV